MKKLIKMLLCLALVAMLVFAPAIGHQDPGPDDRPIPYHSYQSITVRI